MTKFKNFDINSPMIEKQIKDDYRLNKRSGITELQDYFYMPVRITGSGLNLRKTDSGELILADRQKSEFFNEAFLEHCKSLPIIIDHPVTSEGEKEMLNSKTLPNNAIIGNTIDAWINEDEIWGLARIYDKTLIDKIKQGEIQSTSPGVRIYYESTDPDITTELPFDINHLAFCERGHWDIGDSKGFDASSYEKLDLKPLTNDENFDSVSNDNDKGVGMQVEKLNDTQTTANDSAAADFAPKVEKANDIAPAVAGALGGIAAAKATDSDETSDKNADEPKGEEKEEVKADEPKADDGEKTEKANDAEGESSSTHSNLAHAASLMAKASHAGLKTHTSETSSPKEETVAEEIVEKDKVAKEDEAKKDAEKKDEKKEVKADDSCDEAIDSENETDDDKEREKELKEMRKVCDSADANLNVRMPYINGRQTYRAVAHKFISANKGFLDKKYANLALDSYTPELAKEVLESVYANIRKASTKQETRVKGGWQLLPDGSYVNSEF